MTGVVGLVISSAVGVFHWQALDVTSYLLIVRNRLEDEQDSFVCGRTDRFRRTPDGLRISRRRIALDQSVILSKNMSVMF